MDKDLNKQPCQFLETLDLRRMQYSLTMLLLDYLRAFEYEGFPLKMGTIIEDLGALFELLKDLEEKKGMDHGNI
jgi:hypothetical protein